MSIDRRQLLRKAACGFGGIALHSLLSGEARAGVAPVPHFRPRAKRVIFLFMRGGPSPMDTFDYKPLLQRDHNQTADVHKLQKVQNRQLGRLLKSPFSWRQYGEGGLWISEIFPHLSRQADKLCVVRSMHTEGFDHGQAILRLQTGEDAFIRPSIGSWVAYGLGTENSNLPAFVSMNPGASVLGTRGFSNVFLPGNCQGMPIGVEGIRAQDAAISHLAQATPSQARLLSRIQQRNREHLVGRSDPRLEGRISNYELAFRMQQLAPELMDVERESEATRKLYGVGEKPTDDFARRCLLARRMAEAGVRFIQITHQHKEGTKVPYWDQHNDLEYGLRENAARVDKPIAGLLQDLEARGLLDDTLIWWGGEFGRTPVREFRNKSIGRDHNPLGFTQWLAGAGVRGGYAHGQTDDYGYRAAVDKVHMHDMHATILHLLGIDHERLTYRYAGRDFRLTDVYGNVIHKLIG
ncbi:MAG: DUF1501 domain-containing protein [Limisphaerales bacterium]